MAAQPGFVSDQVGNTEDRFSHIVTHFINRSKGKRHGTNYSEFSAYSRISDRSQSSVYSYESERLSGAVRLRKAPSSIGISIDSDNEDRR